MKQKRIAGLDFLRAIAIIGIIIYHAYPDFLPGGYLGVMAFFMIMGYLMVYGKSQLDEYTPVRSAISYYKRKIKRLYPPLIVLLCFVLLAMSVFARSYPKSMTKEVLSILLGYNNLWQIFQNSSYFDRLLNTSPLTHLWYIGLTIQYYLLFPILFFLGLWLYRQIEKRKKGLGIKLIIAMLFVLAIISVLMLSLKFSPDKDPSRLYYGTDTRAFSLLTGMIIALIPMDKIEESLKPNNTTIIVIASAALLLIYIFCVLAHGEQGSNYHFYMPVGNIIYAVFFMCLLMAQEGLGVFLEKKPFVVLGKYSYEMYLCMYPCLWFIGRVKLLSESPTGIHLLVVIATISASSFLLYHASRWLYASLRSITLIPVKYRRFVPSAMLIFCLISCMLQSYVSTKYGKNDMSKLEAHLSDEQASMNEDNAALLIQMRGSQLASISENAEVLTSSIEQNLAARQAAQAADPNAQTTPEEITATTPIIPPVLSATAIGDSVMLGGSSALMNKIGGLYVDAAKNRRVSQAVDIVNALSSQGLLGKVVIIHLGTNSVMTVPDYQAVIDTIGTEHTIYWVNSYGPDWAGAVNENVSSVVDANSNVFLIDWYNYAINHPDWFASDNIHLTDVGADAYAGYIKECTGL